MSVRAMMFRVLMIIIKMKTETSDSCQWCSSESSFFLNEFSNLISQSHRLFPFSFPSPLPFHRPVTGARFMGTCPVPSSFPFVVPCPFPL